MIYYDDQQRHMYSAHVCQQSHEKQDARACNIHMYTYMFSTWIIREDDKQVHTESPSVIDDTEHFSTR